MNFASFSDDANLPLLGREQALELQIRNLKDEHRRQELRAFGLVVHVVQCCAL